MLIPVHYWCSLKHFSENESRRMWLHQNCKAGSFCMEHGLSWRMESRLGERWNGAWLNWNTPTSLCHGAEAGSVMGSDAWCTQRCCPNKPLPTRMETLSSGVRTHPDRMASVPVPPTYCGWLTFLKWIWWCHSCREALRGFLSHLQLLSWTLERCTQRPKSDYFPFLP